MALKLVLLMSEVHSQKSKVVEFEKKVILQVEAMQRMGLATVHCPGWWR